MKKLIFYVLLFMTLICFNIYNVSGARIDLDDEENQDGSGRLTLFIRDYYIDINQDNIGNVMYQRNNEEIIIGTCEVILICNGVEINICNSNENDFGKIVIEMEYETKGDVKETEGKIGNIFDIDSNIIYVS